MSTLQITLPRHVYTASQKLSSTEFGKLLMEKKHVVRLNDAIKCVYLQNVQIYNMKEEHKCNYKYCALIILAADHLLFAAMPITQGTTLQLNWFLVKNVIPFPY
ncbi:hypothetical protein Glove_99g328 [Diversispora epigaea]|uniref:Uncharacterized protein n=1 Tax=Diversispora epigaea TaxID=1348612 RepID=A0A397J721_9GLOM|nr:hypothetical protein Glove_99g328 [Diversispora epigaea]